jgi:hypothetical protein
MIYGRLVKHLDKKDALVQLDFDAEGIKELRWLLSYGLNTNLHEHPDLLALADKLDQLEREGRLPNETAVAK